MERMTYSRGRALQGGKEAGLNRENALHNRNSSLVERRSQRTEMTDPNKDDLGAQSGSLAGNLPGDCIGDSMNANSQVVVDFPYKSEQHVEVQSKATTQRSSHGMSVGAQNDHNAAASESDPQT